MTTRQKSNSLAALRKAQTEVDAVRTELRDKKCVAPKYPGKPEDYTYVITEYCLRKDRKRGSRTSTTAASSSRGNAAQRAASRKLLDVEIKIIRDELRLRKHDVSRGVSGSVLDAQPVIFQYMIKPEKRELYPDPRERFSHLVERMEVFDWKEYVGKKLPNLYLTTLSMVLEHLLILQL